MGVDVGWLMLYGSSHSSSYGAPKASGVAWTKIRVARRFGAALVLQNAMQEASSQQALMKQAAAILLVLHMHFLESQKGREKQGTALCCSGTSSSQGHKRR